MAVVAQAGNGATQPQRATLDAKRAILDKVDCFIFDCDGVIWRGDSVIDGVPETLDMLREMGKQLVFVTNNSTKSRAGYLNKFTGLGLQVKAEEIYSSSYAAAAYLESINFPHDKKVYVVGEVGIQEELDLKGINHIGGPADAGKKVELTPGMFLEHDHDVAAVVVGFDRNINYYKIQMATLCIRENPGCMFIATNLDAVTHLTDAQEWAGNGSMVGAIRGSTKREPTVVGKPAEFMLANIADKFNLKREQICMVGDRLDTDVLFGKNGGLTTMLVLSGVTTEEQLLSPENSIHPDAYMDSLAALLEVKQPVAAHARQPLSSWQQSEWRPSLPCSWLHPLSQPRAAP
ncbi:phosphoglycolate phosphatase [Micractinium conductrix]|uniref:phosphoglycolate phosphatase n=1 Tax=Micractinium conductrix TaxID=554055 RepID=A0A2P6VB96_9CHLO|nr:phosphoglycolate phosphatase [Micractinium conductrix]|eukprot:PSC71367.1 phosphoglycolate phosphatase [Micractinium conductrix]